MNTLEKVLDFEKEADDIIQKARKRASELLAHRDEEVKTIEKDFEDKIVKGKEALRAEWNRKLSALDKEEAQRREIVLKKMRTDFSSHINKAVEIVINHIV